MQCKLPVLDDFIGLQQRQLGTPVCYFLRCIGHRSLLGGFAPCGGLGAQGERNDLMLVGQESEVRQFIDKDASVDAVERRGPRYEAWT